ncbi:MAG: hypothetical protein ACRD3E_03505 [Terriglobales bacterium]
MSCAICHERREKRFCPAVHDKICPICCGTEREVTLDCPSDCTWLQQARKNENADHLRELDREALIPEVEVPESILYQWEPLIGGLSFALAQAARADRGVYDRDIIEALTSLVRSYQTLVNSGLVVEQKTANLGQQAVSAEVRKMIDEYRELETKRLGYSRLRDSDLLKALVFLVRLALGRTSGRPKSRAFLDFLYAQFPEKRPLEGAAESRIIVP